MVKKQKISKNLSIDQLKEQLARSQADYQNLEKRIEQQRQLFITLATSTIISKMIDVLDDLYITQSHLKDQGLEIAINKFIAVLKVEGLEEIIADSQEFDPNLMDCLEVKKGIENQVLEVRKKGYKLNGQVIRPAQVIVGKQSN
jgi:molecular chaperone GrpE